MKQKKNTDKSEYNSPVYRMASDQFKLAAKHLGLNDGVVERLIRPKRAMMVSVPVRMDDGRIKVFDGYRVQHIMALGPCKGGIRYHPDVSLGEVTALAMWMSLKCALMHLPLSGGKGGIRCNPESMSRNELQRMTRRYTAELFLMIGPDTDIPAPDMGTNAQTMAWIMDTYSQHRGYTVPGCVTGKPLSVGGSLGREEATGRGVVYTVQEAAKQIKLNLKKSTAVVQGFGNVGSIAAKYLEKLGSKVLAVSDSKGAIYNKKGLSIEKVIRFKEKNNSLINFPGSEPISTEELFAIKCDILVPAAMERQITEKNAPFIDCRILAEGANGPTTNKADEILHNRGILVLPDILANSGGVIVSYFEWVQGMQNFFWSEKEVITNLHGIMTKAFAQTLKLSIKKKVSIRTAALIIGMDKISDAMMKRGFYA